MILRIGLGIWFALHLLLAIGMTISADMSKIIFVIADIIILIGIFVGDTIANRISVNR